MTIMNTLPITNTTQVITTEYDRKKQEIVDRHKNNVSKNMIYCILGSLLILEVASIGTGIKLKKDFPEINVSNLKSIKQTLDSKLSQENPQIRQKFTEAENMMKLGTYLALGLTGLFGLRIGHNHYQANREIKNLENFYFSK